MSKQVKSAKKSLSVGTQLKVIIRYIQSYKKTISLLYNLKQFWWQYADSGTQDTSHSWYYRSFGHFSFNYWNITYDTYLEVLWEYF